jgi:dTDP-4-dehydrorhamnose 3,5-epimerase
MAVACLAADSTVTKLGETADSGMRFSSTGISGAWVIDPEPREDARGRFLRAWCSQELTDQGIHFQPVQANLGYSIHKGTVRGMHFQTEPALEAKLVRCTRGSMFDVVLDVRPGSPSFGKWCGVELTPENARMLFLPEGCAHGYQTLQDATEMYYMTSAFYAPGAATGVRFDDPAFGIQWPLAATAVSEQDRNWPLAER